MRRKHFDRGIAAAYHLITVAFVACIALSDTFWTVGVTSGLDRAIVLLFVYAMGTWVAGSKARD